MCSDTDAAIAQAGVFALTSQVMLDIRLLRSVAQRAEPGSELQLNALAALARIHEESTR